MSRKQFARVSRFTRSIFKMFPSFSLHDKANRSGGNAESPADFVRSHSPSVKMANFYYLLLCQLGSVYLRPASNGPMPELVGCVCLNRVPPKIVYGCVFRIPIIVAALRTLWRLSLECQQDKSVDSNKHALSASLDIVVRVFFLLKVDSLHLPPFSPVAEINLLTSASDDLAVRQSGVPRSIRDRHCPFGKWWRVLETLPWFAARRDGYNLPRHAKSPSKVSCVQGDRCYNSGSPVFILQLSA